ncbi:MAG: hypothetical protein IJ776_07795 [Paludibacteraceae bacterium]|nr:hypothetical protein [Paludibacteraceae bacterium]
MRQKITHEQFTAIYLPLGGKMYALAYNLLRNSDEARDCVQEIYSELWNKRYTIESEKPPLPLVLTMVRNKCMSASIRPCSVRGCRWQRRGKWFWTV